MRNLREVAPNWYFNVPKGFEALLPYLRSDAQLRRNFFSRLKVLWYAGAGIAQNVFDEMKQLAANTCGESILFLTGLGSTETAPYAFGRTWDTDRANNIGLPPPGVEVKLVPMDGKLEARLRRSADRRRSTARIACLASSCAAVRRVPRRLPRQAVQTSPVARV